MNCISCSFMKINSFNNSHKKSTPKSTRNISYRKVYLNGSTMNGIEFIHTPLGKKIYLLVLEDRSWKLLCILSENPSLEINDAVPEWCYNLSLEKGGSRVRKLFTNYSFSK